MTSGGFTQKEMLISMMSKLEVIENKLNQTHVQTLVTNGKVKLHTKLITGIGSVLIVIIGWIVSNFLK